MADDTMEIFTEHDYDGGDIDIDFDITDDFPIGNGTEDREMSTQPAHSNGDDDLMIDHDDHIDGDGTESFHMDDADIMDGEELDTLDDQPLDVAFGEAQDADGIMASEEEAYPQADDQHVDSEARDMHSFGDAHLHTGSEAQNKEGHTEIDFEQVDVHDVTEGFKTADTSNNTNPTLESSHEIEADRQEVVASAKAAAVPEHDEDHADKGEALAAEPSKEVLGTSNVQNHSVGVMLNAQGDEDGELNLEEEADTDVLHSHQHVEESSGPQDSDIEEFEADAPAEALEDADNFDKNILDGEAEGLEYLLGIKETPDNNAHTLETLHDRLPQFGVGTDTHDFANRAPASTVQEVIVHHASQDDLEQHDHSLTDVKEEDDEQASHRDDTRSSVGTQESDLVLQSTTARPLSGDFAESSQLASARSSDAGSNQVPVLGQFVHEESRHQQLKVLYQDNEYDLFETSDNSNPDSYFLSDFSIVRQPLSNLFKAIRDIIYDDLGPDLILCLEIRELGMSGLDELNCGLVCQDQDISLAKIMDLRDRLMRNDGINDLEYLEPMRLILTTKIKPNFATRFAALTAGADTGLGLAELDEFWGEQSDDFEPVEDYNEGLEASGEEQPEDAATDFLDVGVRDTTSGSADDDTLGETKLSIDTQNAEDDLIDYSDNEEDVIRIRKSLSPGTDYNSKNHEDSDAKNEELHKPSLPLTNKTVVDGDQSDHNGNHHEEFTTETETASGNLVNDEFTFDFDERTETDMSLPTANEGLGFGDADDFKSEQSATQDPLVDGGAPELMSESLEALATDKEVQTQNEQHKSLAHGDVGGADEFEEELVFDEKSHAVLEEPYEDLEDEIDFGDDKELDTGIRSKDLQEIAVLKTIYIDTANGSESAGTEHTLEALSGQDAQDHDEIDWNDDDDIDFSVPTQEAGSSEKPESFKRAREDEIADESSDSQEAKRVKT